MKDGQKHKVKLTGMRLYVQVLRALHDKQMTAKDLVEEIGLYNPQSAMEMLRQFHGMGLAHVCARSRNETVWSYGSGPSTCKPMRPSARLIAFTSLFRELECPTMRRELEEATGLSESCIASVLLCMRKLRMAHIAGWHCCGVGCGSAPMYMIGFDKEDVKRPKPKPLKVQYLESSQRRRERRLYRRMQAVVPASQA